MKALVQKFKHRFSNPFVRNAGWLGVAELVNRIFRLGTTITLARLFTPNDYGLLALLYTIQSFSEVFTTGVGIGAKIIQVEAQDLESTCNTAYWMNWILCVSIFLLQCLLSIPIAWIYQDNRLILPICMLGIRYLLIPIFKIQSSLIKRENRLKISALANGCQSIISNLITISLALLGMGIWSVVWATLISTLTRIIINYWNHPWRPPSSFQLTQWKAIAGFSIDILGVRLLDKLRLNLDYLIVGRFLGVEALGLYFFAFNAGIGISQNVINILISSLFPYLCEVREKIHKVKQRYFSSLRKIILVVVPIDMLQSLAAPFYVPIIFGSQWSNAIPILQLVCLSAIPLAISFSATQLLNVLDNTRLNLMWNCFYTIYFAVAILIAAKIGLTALAIAVLVSQASTLVFSGWAVRHVFKKAISYI